MWRKDDRIGKRKERIKIKDRWGKIDVIPLLPLLGVNCRQPVLHMSKILVYLYATDKQINQFAINFIINPTFQVNKVFIEQVKIS